MSQLKDIISQLQKLELEEKNKQQAVQQPIHKVDTCCICLDDITTKKNTTTLQCGHGFHLPCFMEFILAGRQSNNQSCPLCRNSVGFTEEVQSKLSSGNQGVVNEHTVMDLTNIQQDIVDTLKFHIGFAYTPNGIQEKLTRYAELKDIKSNCKLLAEGNRVNMQRGLRGRHMFSYNREWDSQ